MALGVARGNLISDPQFYNKYVFVTDIKGFFDDISHEWLISHIPLEITLKPILIAWLKSGSINFNKFYPNSENYKSTFPAIAELPVARIAEEIEWDGISPTLVNFTLNGLEKAVDDKMHSVYHINNRGIYLGKFNGTSKYFMTQSICIRYGDDVIITARSKRMITEVIKPAVSKFLSEKGLWLSDEKTKILSVANSDKINFLGYTFQLIHKFSPKYRLFKDKIGRKGIACYPQKEQVQAIKAKLNKIFRASQNLYAYSLIAKLNPIIRSWANYFNISQSYEMRHRVNEALYRYTWAWAKRKHPKWGKKAIAKVYFLSPQPTKEEKNSLAYHIVKSYGKTTGQNKRKWIFRGRTLNPSIYNQFDRGKFIELASLTHVTGTYMAKMYRIPRALELVHAYHPYYTKLLDFNLKNSIEAMKETGTLKGKLLNKQKGICTLCQQSLLNETGEFIYDGTTNIHHILERSKGGSKFSLSNLTLVHKDCHYDHHRSKNTASRT
jgi:RNA-directed DNA polymerase